MTRRAARRAVRAAAACSGSASSTWRRIDERLLDLPRANHEPRSDVSALFDRNLEPQTRVGVVWMVSPEVGVHAGRARRDADDPEVARRLIA